MRILKRQLLLISALALIFAGSVPQAQQAPAAQLAPQAGQITAPKEEFGNNIGDDFYLANFQQLHAYWKKLDGQSDRMQLVEIGQAFGGRDHSTVIHSVDKVQRQLARDRVFRERVDSARAELTAP